MSHKNNKFALNFLHIIGLLYYTTFLQTNQGVSLVYHQVAENTPSVMIYAYGDDIHAKA